MFLSPEAQLNGSCAVGISYEWDLGDQCFALGTGKFR